MKIISTLILALMLALMLVAAKGDRDEFPGRRQGGGSWGAAVTMVYA